MEDDSGESHQIMFMKNKTRVANIKRFKQQFPECKDLSNKQIVMVFKLYRKLSDRTFAPTNLTMVVTGTLIILITGLFINGGAGGDLTASDDISASPNAIVMNTVISSATSGLTLMIMSQFTNMRFQDNLVQQTGMVESYNVQHLCNAIIAGFVSISAACDSVYLWQSCFIGLVGCIIYSQTRKILTKFEIDDPLDTT